MPVPARLWTVLVASVLTLLGPLAPLAAQDDAPARRWRVHIWASYESTGTPTIRWAEGADYMVRARTEGEATRLAYELVPERNFARITDRAARATEPESECGDWVADIRRTFTHRTTGVKSTQNISLELRAKTRQSAETKAKAPVRPPVAHDLTDTRVLRIVEVVDGEEGAGRRFAALAPPRGGPEAAGPTGRTVIQQAIYVAQPVAAEHPRFRELAEFLGGWEVQVSEGEATPGDETETEIASVPAAVMVAGSRLGDLLQLLFELEDAGLLEVQHYSSTETDLNSPAASQWQGSYRDSEPIDWLYRSVIEGVDLAQTRAARVWIEITSRIDGQRFIRRRSSMAVATDEPAAWLIGFVPQLPSAGTPARPAVLAVVSVRQLAEVGAPGARADAPADRPLGEGPAECSYEESFVRPPRNWSCGDQTVRWCREGLDWVGRSGCDANGSLRIVPGAADTTRLWFSWGASRPAAIRIQFNYMQWAGDPPVENMAASFLDYLLTDNASLADCTNGGFRPARRLERTWTTTPTCTAVTYDLPVGEDDRAVCWQFRKDAPGRGRGIVMNIDDVRVTLIPAAQAPGDEPER